MTGRFVKLQCTKCNNEQNVYEKATTQIKCLVCNEVLANNTGAMAEITDKAKVLKILG